MDLDAFGIARQEDLLAITTPVPDHLGNVSIRTPVFHLPVYMVSLFGSTESDTQQLEFHCDLADLTDLISKLKQLNEQWTRSI